MLVDRKSLGTSLNGSVAETQVVLDLCMQHGLTANVKIIPIPPINEASTSVDKDEVDFRYIIAMASLKAVEAA